MTPDASNLPLDLPGPPFPAPIRHGSPPALARDFIYSVIHLGADEPDLIGLTWLDPVDPISREIRHKISENIYRVIMRAMQLEIEAESHCSDGDHDVYTVVYGWQVLDVDLAVKAGYLKKFAELRPMDRAKFRKMRREFVASIQPANLKG